MHSRIRALCLLAPLALALLASTQAQAEGDASAAPPAQAPPANVLVLRENATGSAATAQPYVDALMVHLARANGWSGANGTYHTKRAAAKSYIATAQPQYGILSLGAFLALRGDLKLQVVGQAEVEGGGGLQYYVVSKTQSDLAGCKGKTLATNHGGDTRFVEKVIAQGAFVLGDFTVETTSRPVQTLKKVLSGEAECALIDDAQMGELTNLEGGAQVHPVWFSATMPPMPIVAFANATAQGVSGFKAALASVCAGDGAQACAAAGIKALRESDGVPYDAVIASSSVK